MSKRTAVICFLYLLTSFSQAEIKKSWEINLSKIFHADIEGDFTEQFSPVYWNEKLLLCSDRGVIKSIDIATKHVKLIRTIPLKIETVANYGKNHFIFHGRHRSKPDYYYYAVDIVKKSIKGRLKLKKPLWKFDDWAMFEKHKQFLVFNPKIGKVVYYQKAGSSMEFPVYSPDERNVFFNQRRNLMELILPEIGAGLAFTRPDNSKMVVDPKPLLKFNVLDTLDQGIIPDNLRDEILYYHKENGTIGQLNLKTKEILWEREFFKPEMKISIPHEYKDKLYYLISYAKKGAEKRNKGKIIAINRKTGYPDWLSKDLYFYNFHPIQFGTTIISGDTNGNVLFLDLETGATQAKFQVGSSLTTPIVVNDDVFIKTEKKLFCFTNKQSTFKKLFSF
ncbi:hypothetical protein HOH45_09355 [bacterium]|jgi:hypothetical protein|nr:hypothetical protein [bacterium]